YCRSWCFVVHASGYYCFWGSGNFSESYLSKVKRAGDQVLWSPLGSLVLYYPVNQYKLDNRQWPEIRMHKFRCGSNGSGNLCITHVRHAYCFQVLPPLCLPFTSKKLKVAKSSSMDNLFHHCCIDHGALPHARGLKFESPHGGFLMFLGLEILDQATRLMLEDARKFGREDFCLITGFRFGKMNLDPNEKDHSEFHKRFFPKIANLKGEHLLTLVKKDVEFNQLDGEDVVRACLLLALDFVFMGQELRHVLTNPIVNLVDDFYKWDAFPRGEYMWSFFHKRDYNVVANRRKYHLQKLASNPKYEANYVLYSFVFPLKIWGLETFSNSIHWWRKDENVIPRGVAWSNGLKSSLDFIERVTPSTPVLRSATRGSSNSKSVHTRVRTEVRHEVHVRTEVRRFVDKEEVRTRAVDEEYVKEIVLDKNWNDVSDNFPIDGLDHQSVEGASQCMSVDHVDKHGNPPREALHPLRWAFDETRAKVRQSNPRSPSPSRSSLQNRDRDGKGSRDTPCASLNVVFSFMLTQVIQGLATQQSLKELFDLIEA
ncbi:phospholipase-like protein, partial [Tanacetum coccineum]